MSQNAGATRTRVLVVDDEEALLAAYDRVLQGDQFEVVKADNGRVARDLLKQHTFDVVVSDLSMPEMDGIALLRAVREQDLDLPVILVTGTPSLATAQEAIEHGVLRYLTKPVSPDELVKPVTRASMLIRLARLKREAMAHLGQQDAGAGDRAGLEVAFERAMQGIWMAYQPIVRYSERKEYAYETLLRYTDRTFPHPGAILDAAERLGRLHDLGRLVRAHVAGTVGAQSALEVFINLHPHDLLDETLYDPSAPLSNIAQRVVLEVTERASLDDVGEVAGRVARLRKLGYRVAIDDIGAGYAGLTSVASLQPEVMKIDMALVRNIDQDPVKQKLVRAMVALCRDMGVTVVAEGIETPPERDTVVEIGCDLLQGYLFAKPDKPFIAAKF